MPDLSGRTLGGYRLQSLIGQGGMATVYLALHGETGRPAAVKVLSPQIAENEQFLHRFQREAKVLSRLSHPNIVAIEGFEEVEGVAFLVMPFIQGGSLADRLARGPLHPTEGGQIVEEISSALQHAHDRQIVHRDVKPSNILLAADGRAMLSDFGLAQIHDASMSLTGSALLGTPAYVSPEQARGEPVTGLSDQYSLGVVLFEMTTGSLPFEAETPLALLLKHAREITPPPRSVNPNIPPAVERVIQRATAKRPEDRFPTVADLNRAFQAALAHALRPLENPSPTIPLPEAQRRTTIQRQARARRRRRVLLGSAAALLALILCGSSAFLTGLLGAPKPQADTAQLTALAGTIQVLSMSLSGGEGGTLAPGALATALIGTLSAGEATPDPTTLALVLGNGVTPSTSPAIPASIPGAAALPATPTPATGAASTTTPGPSPAAVGSNSTVQPTSPQPATPTLSPAASSTPSLAWTATPPASPTSLPPTATTAASPCWLVQHVGSSRSGQEMTFVLRNAGTTPFTITQMTLAWPGSNGELKKIELDGDEIWNDDTDSPVTITNWNSGEDRDLYPGGNRYLVLFFDDDAAASGYSLSITLEGTCSLAVSS